MRRFFLFASCLIALAAGVTAARADGDGADEARVAAGAMGLHIIQDNAIVPLIQGQDGVYEAAINPAPFAFVFAFLSGPPDAFAVTFGLPGLFDYLDLPPDNGLFAPAGAYARYAEPEAPYYFTDPACVSEFFGPGWNLILPEHQRGDLYHVSGIVPDQLSRRCTAPGRLPEDWDALDGADEIHAVLEGPGGELLRFRLIPARS
ncbi:MAG: hypothetical protein AAF825_08305 [Pseudomonadota bacterium]